MTIDIQFSKHIRQTGDASYETLKKKKKAGEWYTSLSIFTKEGAILLEKTSYLSKKRR